MKIIPSNLDLIPDSPKNPKLFGGNLEHCGPISGTGALQPITVPASPTRTPSMMVSKSASPEAATACRCGLQNPEQR
jgi:hypothetical protein